MCPWAIVVPFVHRSKPLQGVTASALAYAVVCAKTIALSSRFSPLAVVDWIFALCNRAGFITHPLRQCTDPLKEFQIEPASFEYKTLEAYRCPDL